MYFLNLKYNKKLFQLIYQHKITNTGYFILQRLSKYNKDNEKKAYLYKIFKFYLFNEKYIDEFIKNNVLKSEKDFQILSIVDLIVLEIGVSYTIINYFLNPKVIINEMIKLSKVFSDENSYKFINKVLDRAFKGER